MMWMIGIATIVLVIGMYNQIIHAQVKVDEAKSGIDVALAKRYAVLCNMQESVKGYMRHESEALEKIVNLRKGMNVNEMNELNRQLNAAEHQLFALAESYPDLKASELFRDFHEAIVDCEEHLQAARRFYNSNVAILNDKIQQFPMNLMAGWMKKEKAEFFEARAAEKENVQAKF